MAKRPIITDYREADFLLTAPVFVVDIETNTEAPDESWPKDTYGTSYVADITTVAFYAPGFAPVVLDVRGYPQDMLDFVRAVFERENYTVIGHYVVFDLRSLGGHFGFKIPCSAKVYDTRTVACFIMLAGKGELSLQALVEKFDLIEDMDDSAFYHTLKGWRGALHAMEKNLSRQPADNVVWRYTRGYPRFQDLNLPSSEVLPEVQTLIGIDSTDLSSFDLSQHAQEVLAQYSALDVIFPYKLYEIYESVIDQVVLGDVEIANCSIPKWTKLRELIAKELEISRVSANLAIQGVDVDREYVQLKRDEWAAIIEEEMQTILAMPDNSTPNEAWHNDFQWMLWAGRMLGVANGTETFSDIKRWVNFTVKDGGDSIPVQLLDEFMRHMRIDIEFNDAAERSEYCLKWAEWVFSLDFGMTRSQVLKSIPVELREHTVPTFDLVKWVHTVCFPNSPALIGEYLAGAKTRWLTHVHTSTRELQDIEVVNSLLWRPYHIFVICGVMPPTSEEIVAEQDLVTSKFQKLLRDANDLLRTLKDPSKPKRIDELQLALRTNTLSFGKKAIDYYLTRFELEQEAESNPLFAHYARLKQIEANLERAEEFLLHSSRDGRIHSIVDRGAVTTHRYSSNSPNLQNVKMQDKSIDSHIDNEVFTGFLVAPDGYVLCELDLSNAENKTGAMISVDDSFAWATESGDFHSANARVYWPDEWAAAEAAGDRATLKKLRTNSKAITFAIPYGAGPQRIARVAKVPLDTAREFIERRKQAFPKVEQKKKEVVDNCLLRFKRGYNPPYIPLWTGNRVAIQTLTNSETGERFIPYTHQLWNYIQQGGVAEIVARATVAIDKMLEQEGFQSFLTLNVHDSIIVAVHLDEWDRVLTRIAQIMCQQVPDELTHKTIPPIHFVTEIGPENAQKWGWRYNRDYPLPLDKFVNQWGVFDLPESELQKPPEKREAPTWVGPMHTGWTLAAEIETCRKQRMEITLADAEMAAPAVVTEAPHEWEELDNILRVYDATLKQLAYAAVAIQPHRKVAQIQYFTKDGQAKNVGPFDFPQRMLALEVLKERGHKLKDYEKAIVDINGLLTLVPGLVELTNKLADWQKRHADKFPDLK